MFDLPVWGYAPCIIYFVYINLNLSRPRCYPEGFAKRLMELYETRPSFPLHLRHREHVDTTLTDRQLFSRMDLGDPWVDAGMQHVWKYLYNCPHVQIPDSWIAVMRKFDAELTNLVPSLGSIDYNSINIQSGSLLISQPPQSLDQTDLDSGLGVRARDWTARVQLVCRTGVRLDFSRTNSKMRYWTLKWNVRKYPQNNRKYPQNRAKSRKSDFCHLWYQLSEHVQTCPNKLE